MGADHDRTRLFRLIRTHQQWANRFLAEPTLLGISDSFGIELIHPKPEGCSKRQIEKKGKSNHRWIVGGKFCPLINSRGQIVDWDAEGANVHDSVLQRMLKDYASGEPGASTSTAAFTRATGEGQLRQPADFLG